MKKFDENVVQQHHVPESNYVADFYLPSKNLLVEVNGPTHYIKRIQDGKVVVTDELNGRTRAKMQRIRDSGLNIASINFTTFSGEKTATQIEEELRVKLGF